MHVGCILIDLMEISLVEFMQPGIANFLGITIHEDDIELPPAYLDYEAMVRHHFVERNDQFLQYRLIFDR